MTLLYICETRIDAIPAAHAASVGRLPDLRITAVENNTCARSADCTTVFGVPLVSRKCRWYIRLAAVVRPYASDATRFLLSASSVAGTQSSALDSSMHLDMCRESPLSSTADNASPRRRFSTTGLLSAEPEGVLSVLSLSLPALPLPVPSASVLPASVLPSVLPLPAVSLPAEGLLPFALSPFALPVRAPFLAMWYALLQWFSSCR